MQPHDTTTEEWRPVVGLESFYSVSSLGRVRRDMPDRATRVGRIMQGALNRKGYRVANLSAAGHAHSIAVAKLVADAFLGPKPAGYQRNHKDGDKLNNAVGNLEYVSPSENVRHSYRLGLASNQGSRHPGAKLTEDVVREIRRTQESSSTLAARLGVSYYTIWDVRRGRSWQHVT